VVMGVMAAVGYGVYVTVWQKPEPPGPDVASTATSPPTVQIPGINSPASQMPGATSLESTNATPVLLGGSSAPAFSANPSAASASGGSMVGAAPVGVSSPGNGGVTLLAPPNQSGTGGGSQPGILGNASPSAFNSTAPNQVPAATYPPANSFAGPSPAGTSALMSSPGGDFSSKYVAFMDAVQKKLEEGRLPEAQLALSSLYDNPDLPQSEAREITDLLDQLAGTVIYSRKHYLEQPYIVQPGETLEQIAEKYTVPATLLARINGLRDPQPLEPGRELKVVRGPFSAVIHLERHELTLMVHGRYAGRFAIGVGSDQPNLEGSYTVLEKNLNPLYRGPDGVTVSGGDPRNPLGRYWIGLSDKIGLHGTVDPQNIGRDDNRGAICLSDRDIDDLFGILSVGSRVVIQR
jgi:LysM repeat protein